MRTFRYHRVDVFTDRPFGGNPLAVFLDARGLEVAEMQALAREMNLSETAFVVPPTKKDVAARLRIFTIDRELPLAGHPTVGAAFALAASGKLPLKEGRNVVPIELGAGVFPVEIEVAGGEPKVVFMTARAPEFGEPFLEREVIAAALGLTKDQVEVGDLHPRVVNTGIPWFLVPLRDLQALRTMKPHPLVLPELASVVGTDLFHAFTLDTGDPDCTARTRHVWWGTVTPGEDPVTGSAIGCIASYLVHEEVILASPEATLSIEQGEEVGRPGKVTTRVERAGGAVRKVQVGGMCVSMGDGEIRIP